MVRAARFFSIVSLCSAVLALSVLRFGFPLAGFEGAMVFGGLALCVGAIAAAIALLLCAAVYVRRKVRLTWPFICSAAAGAVLLVAGRIA
jgi:hypothetical protein